MPGNNGWGSAKAPNYVPLDTINVISIHQDSCGTCSLVGSDYHNWTSTTTKNGITCPEMAQESLVAARRWKVPTRAFCFCINIPVYAGSHLPLYSPPPPLQSSLFLTHLLPRTPTYPRNPQSKANHRRSLEWVSAIMTSPEQREGATDSQRQIYQDCRFIHQHQEGPLGDSFGMISNQSTAYWLERPEPEVQQEATGAATNYPSLATPYSPKRWNPL